MKRLAAFLLFLSVAAAAQIPNPQIPLTGNIGAGGIFPLFNGGTLVLAADANHTLAYPETSAAFIKVTSSVALTTTRTLVAPLGLGMSFTFYNDTAGGQTLNVCGTSGTCAAVPNDGNPHVVTSDGTNFYTAATSTGLTAVSVATANGFSGVSSGGTAPILTLNVDSSHVLPVNTGSLSLFLNKAGTYTAPAGSSGPSGTPTIACAIAAGTGATCAVVGSNTGGVIEITTGTSTSTSGVIANITFNGAPLSQALNGCVVAPFNSVAATAISAVVNGAGGATTWGIGSVNTPLSAGTFYEWNYVCSQ